MPLDPFVRSIPTNRDTPHSLFLGAGASVSGHQKRLFNDAHRDNLYSFAGFVKHD